MTSVGNDDYEAFDPVTEAAEADLADQAIAAEDDGLDDQVDVETSDEADEADLVEQSRAVPDREEYRRG